jgi:hypothetical protein
VIVVQSNAAMPCSLPSSRLVGTRRSRTREGVHSLPSFRAERNSQTARRTQLINRTELFHDFRYEPRDTAYREMRLCVCDDDLRPSLCSRIETVLSRT